MRPPSAAEGENKKFPSQYLGLKFFSNYLKETFLPCRLWRALFALFFLHLLVCEVWVVLLFLVAIIDPFWFAQRE